MFRNKISPGGVLWRSVLKTTSQISVVCDHDTDALEAAQPLPGVPGARTLFKPAENVIRPVVLGRKNLIRIGRQEAGPGCSSPRMRENFAQGRHFAWQRGYSAFSVNVSHLLETNAYIQNQEGRFCSLHCLSARRR